MSKKIFQTSSNCIVIGKDQIIKEGDKLILKIEGFKPLKMTEEEYCVLYNLFSRLENDLP